MTIKQTFKDAATAYQNTPGHRNFSLKLEYMPHEENDPAGIDNAMSFGYSTQFSPPSTHARPHTFQQATSYTKFSIGTQLRPVTV